MTSETQALIGLGFTALCIFGLLSGAFTDPPRLRRNLQTLRARMRDPFGRHKEQTISGPATAQTKWYHYFTKAKPDTLAMLAVGCLAQAIKFVFLGFVAWGALEGGPLGQWFALFVALSYLQAITNSLGKLEQPAAKD